MISTKDFIAEPAEIKSGWIFQHYLDLPERLMGQDLQITSIFNQGEKTPSMYVYLDAASMEYKYKDFSSGKQGGKYDIVMELFNIDYSTAMFKIINDYNEWIKDGGFLEVDTEYKPVAKYQVDYIQKREWNEKDAAYWLQYNIGTAMLNKYHVYPIEYYNMVKGSMDGVDKITIKQPYVYGYFSESGQCYKIYQPKQDKHKFIKIGAYLQGYDQLEFTKDYLIICSSLKDAMCVSSMVKQVDVIAPDSENTMIKPYILENLKVKYKKVLSLLDNDQAGLTAMTKYKNEFDIEPIYMKSEKDISDATLKYGVDAVKPKLYTLIKNAI